MLIQALIEYYNLIKSTTPNKIPDMGYSEEKIEGNILINLEGKIIGIEDIRIIEKQLLKNDKTKEVQVPIRCCVPTHTKRSAAGYGYFFCDNLSHVLGLSTKTDPKTIENNYKNFTDFKEKNLLLISNVPETETSKSVIAFRNFLLSYNIKTFLASELYFTHKDFLFSVKSNFKFVFIDNDGNRYEIINDNALSKSYNKYYSESIYDNVIGNDIITCEENVPLANIHDVIRLGANPNPIILTQDSMATAQFSKTTNRLSVTNMEKYTKALNYLINNKRYAKINANTYIICWAKTKSDKINALLSKFISLTPSENENIDIVNGFLDKIKHIKTTDINAIDFDEENTTVYTTIIKADGYRFSVQYFTTTVLSKILENINMFYETISIEKMFSNQEKYISLSNLISCSMSDSKEESERKDILCAQFTLLYTSILTNKPLPLSYFYNVLSVFGKKKFYKNEYYQASIIKYFLINHYNQKGNKLMSLNKENSNISYVLGRLFAVAEKVQDETQEKVNKSVKDTYFSSASQNPASVFPQILSQMERNLERYDKTKNIARKVMMNKIIGEIFDKIEAQKLPLIFSEEEKGSFMIGYYHQRNSFYEPQKNNEKEILDKENV